jgi:hypothetical protein
VHLNILHTAGGCVLFFTSGGTAVHFIGKYLDSALAPMMTIAIETQSPDLGNPNIINTRLQTFPTVRNCFILSRH